MRRSSVGIPLRWRQQSQRAKIISLLGFVVAAVLVAGAAEAPPPYRIGGEIKAPRKLSGDAPVYTEEARRARVSGVVIVEATIDENGDVTDARVLKSLPMGLDEAAVAAVKTWKYEPGTRNDEPVPVYFIVTVNFQLDTDFNYGPAFAAFMIEHAELRELVKESEYGRAGELLDRWTAERPGDAGVRLARAYVHVAEGELDDAWRLAQSLTGAEQAEVTRSIADFALQLLSDNPSASAEDRDATAEVGLAAATRALELAEGNANDEARALRTKASLLREQARTTSDAAQRDSLRAEAKLFAAAAQGLQPVMEMQRAEKIAGDLPERTEEARKARVTGVVIVEATIDEQGNVVDARVLKGLPMGLDERALEAVRSWRFKPATMGDHPARTTMTITVPFL